MQNQIFDDDRDTGSKVDAQFENYTVYGCRNFVLSKVFRHEISRGVIELTFPIGDPPQPPCWTSLLPGSLHFAANRTFAGRDWKKKAKRIFYF